MHKLLYFLYFLTYYIYHYLATYLLYFLIIIILPLRFEPRGSRANYVAPTLGHQRKSLFVLMECVSNSFKVLSRQQADVPESTWGEAIRPSCYLANRSSGEPSRWNRLVCDRSRAANFFVSGSVVLVDDSPQLL